MNADEVAKAFDLLYCSGKVKHFGVSNFSSSQFKLLQSRLPKSLITNQVEINPLNFTVFEDGTTDQLQELKIRPMAWSCLAGGDIFNVNTDQTARLHNTLNDLVDGTVRYIFRASNLCLDIKVSLQPCCIVR